ncbi:MAG TPA: hypothetical protein VMH84_18825 [Xanthobacteraceae bacterium]|nr:hypothetical protein [Xanthobacteraceae bacterium]
MLAIIQGASFEDRADANQMAINMHSDTPKDSKDRDKDAQRSTNMNDTIPPLPELAISGMTCMTTDQTTIDSILRAIYDRRPDLFKRMAERDKTGVGGPYDEFSQEFDRFIREELDIRTLKMQTAVFWETRRRARLMYGMQI